MTLRPAAGHRQPVSGGVEVDAHGVTVADLPGEEPAGELVPDRGLHQPPQRPRPYSGSNPESASRSRIAAVTSSSRRHAASRRGAGFRHVVRFGLHTDRETS